MESDSAKRRLGDLRNVSFTLVRPLFLGNIGSIARVMKNFALSELVLVDPPKNYKDAEARKMSVGAFDVLKRALVFPTLHEAVLDKQLVIGTSSGQQRSCPLSPLREVLERTIPASEMNKVTFVLGDERNGLTNEELRMCHHLVRIPTQPEFPSLNVAQAACIIAYELTTYSGAYEKEETRREKLASVSEERALFDLLSVLLETVEFSRSFNRDVVLDELRAFYYRAQPSSRECNLLQGLLHRLNQKLVNLKRTAEQPFDPTQIHKEASE